MKHTMGYMYMRGEDLENSHYARANQNETSPIARGKRKT